MINLRSAEEGISQLKVLNFATLFILIPILALLCFRERQASFKCRDCVNGSLKQIIEPQLKPKNYLKLSSLNCVNIPTVRNKFFVFRVHFWVIYDQERSEQSDYNSTNGRA